MKRTGLVSMTWMAVCVAVAGVCRAADDPTAAYVTPVKQVRAADGFAPNFSGVWDGDNAAFWGKSLYVLSCGPWRIQRLDVDAATGSIAYRDALAMTNRQGVALVHLFARRLADGNGMLDLFFSSDGPPSETSLYTFGIDGKTGAVALRQCLRAPTAHIHWVMAPGDTRLYAICQGRQIVAYRFAADGLPVEDGVYSDGKSHSRNSNGCFSDDGRNLYVADAGQPKDEYPNGHIETYACDPASGKLKYESSMGLPKLPGQDTWIRPAFCGVSPDGGRLYVGRNGSQLDVLRRDAKTGGLVDTVSTNTLPGVAHLYFTREGKAGFYFSQDRFQWFACDPSTGVPVLCATSAFYLHKLRCVAADLEHGNVFGVYQEGADSFKLKR